MSSRFIKEIKINEIIKKHLDFGMNGDYNAELELIVENNKIIVSTYNRKFPTDILKKDFLGCKVFSEDNIGGWDTGFQLFFLTRKGFIRFTLASDSKLKGVSLNLSKKYKLKKDGYLIVRDETNTICFSQGKNVSKTDFTSCQIIEFGHQKFNKNSTISEEMYKHITTRDGCWMTTQPILVIEFDDKTIMRTDTYDFYNAIYYKYLY